MHRLNNPAPEEFKPVEVPVDDALDLHTFQPREVKELLVDYITMCRQKGIFEIRIIHGKGTGQLRRTVHAALDKNPVVKTFRLAGEDAGGWGATIVELKR